MPLASAARRQRSARPVGGLVELDLLGRAARARRRGSARGARRRSARAGRPRAAPRRRPRAPPDRGARCWISSICRRRPVSGVRSWWEESATNSRWLSSIRPTRPVISLKLRARVRCSVVPSTGARASRSPGRDRVGGVGESPDRSGDPLGDQGAGDHAEGEHRQAEQDDPDDRPPHGAVDGGDALGDAHGADHAARGGGSAPRSRGCRPRGCRCGGSPGRGCRRAPRRSRAGSRSRRRSRCSPALSAISSPCPSDDHDPAADRLRRGGDEPFEGLAGSPAPSSSGALAARRSAWLCACPLTSASTRSRRLIASGTPKATTASSRT